MSFEFPEEVCRCHHRVREFDLLPCALRRREYVWSRITRKPGPWHLSKNLSSFATDAGVYVSNSKGQMKLGDGKVPEAFSLRGDGTLAGAQREPQTVGPSAKWERRENAPLARELVALSKDGEARSPITTLSQPQFCIEKYGRSVVVGRCEHIN